MLAEALWRVPHMFGGGEDGKASIERLCLSPYVEKPFNSKVIKSFVPELRSRECFSCFGIPMFYVIYIWTLWKFCVSVWICLFHVFISGYVTFVPDDFFDIIIINSASWECRLDMRHASTGVPPINPIWCYIFREWGERLSIKAAPVALVKIGYELCWLHSTWGLPEEESR